MEEKLNFYEKIIIANNQTNLMVTQLLHLQQNLILYNSNSKKEFMEFRINSIQSFLEELSNSAIENLNSIADYMNDADAVTDIDNKLFDSIFEELNKEE